MRAVRRVVIAMALGLVLAASSMGFGDGVGVPTTYAKGKRLVKVTKPTANSYTLGDMSACGSPSGGWQLCTGPDGSQYGCSTTSGACTKVNGGQ